MRLWCKIIARVEKINVCFCAFSLILCNAPVFDHFRLRVTEEKTIFGRSFRSIITFEISRTANYCETRRNVFYLVLLS